MQCRICQQDKPAGAFDGSRKVCRDCRREQMRAYAQSPAGRAAVKRSHRNYSQKRRERNTSPAFNPIPLAQTLGAWRAQ